MSGFSHVMKMNLKSERSYYNKALWLLYWYNVDVERYLGDLMLLLQTCFQLKGHSIRSL